jgi:hypothetical protein
MPFVEHPLFKPPADRGAPLFRYQDLAKLVSLLHSGALFFARSDQLGDAFEGSTTQASLDYRPDWYDQIPPAAVDSLRKNAGAFRVQNRYWTFVNCWTASATESVAMWRLYVGSGHGLAIESTYDRLTGALGGAKPVFVGMVEYANWKTDVIPDGNSLAPYVYKRAGFEYEHELRAMVWDPPTSEEGFDWSRPLQPGLVLPVDLQGLLARVRLSPFAEHWYREVVESVIAEYGLELEI